MPALNCGFGPMDIRDLTWDHINEQRISMPGSKTGVCQSYLLWLETCVLSEEIQQQIAAAILRMVKRRGQPGNNSHAFMRRFRKSRSKDPVTEQFHKLCKLFQTFEFTASHLLLDIYLLKILRFCISNRRSIVVI